MGDIYFGAVSKFYEAQDVLIPDAAYRKSRQDNDLECSLNMLRKHLSGYFSSASAISPDRVSAGNAVSEMSTTRDSLDDFFK